MNIDSMQPVRVQGVSATGPERQLLPTKGQGSDSQQHSEVTKSTAGNIPSAQATEKAFSEVEQAIEPYNISLKFTRDAETGTIVVQMIDDTSGETLQQFPNAAQLQVAANLTKLQGKIINCQA